MPAATPIPRGPSVLTWHKIIFTARVTGIFTKLIVRPTTQPSDIGRQRTCRPSGPARIVRRLRKPLSGKPPA